MKRSGKREPRSALPLRPRKLRGVRTRSFCTAIRASSRSCWRSRRPTSSGNNGGFPPASPFTLLTCCATVLARAATSPSQPAAPLEAVLGQVHRRAVDALPLPDHRDPLREIRHGPGPGRHADLDRDPGPLCSQAPPSARLVHRRRIEGLITRRIAHVQANPVAPARSSPRDPQRARQGTPASPGARPSPTVHSASPGARRAG